MEEKKFYVYIYRIKYTNEVFYVGKGCGRRYKRIDKRGKFFKDMYNSHECEVIILQRGLTESEAFSLEKLMIAYYRKFTKNRLANICDGGEGASGHRWSNEEKRAIGLRGIGEKNPNYGNYWTPEQKAALSKKQKASGRYVGKMNPNAQPIQCIETGEIFSCIKDAQTKYNVKNQSSFWWAINYPNRTAAGLHWRKSSKQ